MSSEDAPVSFKDPSKHKHVEEVQQRLDKVSQEEPYIDTDENSDTSESTDNVDLAQNVEESKLEKGKIDAFKAETGEEVTNDEQFKEKEVESVLSVQADAKEPGFDLPEEDEKCIIPVDETQPGARESSSTTTEDTGASRQNKTDNTSSPSDSNQNKSSVIDKYIDNDTTATRDKPENGYIKDNTDMNTYAETGFVENQTDIEQPECDIKPLVKIDEMQDSIILTTDKTDTVESTTGDDEPVTKETVSDTGLGLDSVNQSNLSPNRENSKFNDNRDNQYKMNLDQTESTVPHPSTVSHTHPTATKTKLEPIDNRTFSTHEYQDVCITASDDAVETEKPGQTDTIATFARDKSDDENQLAETRSNEEHQRENNSDHVFSINKSGIHEDEDQQRLEKVSQQEQGITTDENSDTVQNVEESKLEKAIIDAFKAETGEEVTNDEQFKEKEVESVLSVQADAKEPGFDLPEEDEKCIIPVDETQPGARESSSTTTEDTGASRQNKTDNTSSPSDSNQNKSSVIDKYIDNDTTATRDKPENGYIKDNTDMNTYAETGFVENQTDIEQPECDIKPLVKIDEMQDSIILTTDKTDTVESTTGDDEPVIKETVSDTGLGLDSVNQSNLSPNRENSKFNDNRDNQDKMNLDQTESTVPHPSTVSHTHPTATKTKLEPIDNRTFSTHEYQDVCITASDDAVETEKPGQTDTIATFPRDKSDDENQLAETRSNEEHQRENNSDHVFSINKSGIHEDEDQQRLEKVSQQEQGITTDENSDTVQNVEESKLEKAIIDAFKAETGEEVTNDEQFKEKEVKSVLSVQAEAKEPGLDLPEEDEKCIIPVDEMQPGARESSSTTTEDTGASRQNKTDNSSSSADSNQNKSCVTDKYIANDTRETGDKPENEYIEDDTDMNYAETGFVENQTDIEQPECDIKPLVKIDEMQDSIILTTNKTGTVESTTGDDEPVTKETVSDTGLGLDSVNQSNLSPNRENSKFNDNRDNQDKMNLDQTESTVPHPSTVSHTHPTTTKTKLEPIDNRTFSTHENQDVCITGSDGAVETAKPVQNDTISTFAPDKINDENELAETRCNEEHQRENNSDNVFSINKTGIYEAEDQQRLEKVSQKEQGITTDENSDTVQNVEESKLEKAIIDEIKADMGEEETNDEQLKDKEVESLLSVQAEAKKRGTDLGAEGENGITAKHTDTSQHILLNESKPSAAESSSTTTEDTSENQNKTDNGSSSTVSNQKKLYDIDKCFGNDTTNTTENGGKLENELIVDDTDEKSQAETGVDIDKCFGNDTTDTTENGGKLENEIVDDTDEKSQSETGVVGNQEENDDIKTPEGNDEMRDNTTDNIYRGETTIGVDEPIENENVSDKVIDSDSFDQSNFTPVKQNSIAENQDKRNLDQTESKVTQPSTVNQIHPTATTVIQACSKEPIDNGTSSTHVNKDDNITDLDGGVETEKPTQNDTITTFTGDKINNETQLARPNQTGIHEQEVEQRLGKVSQQEQGIIIEEKSDMGYNVDTAQNAEELKFEKSKKEEIIIETGDEETNDEQLKDKEVESVLSVQAEANEPGVDLPVEDEQVISAKQTDISQHILLDESQSSTTGSSSTTTAETAVNQNKTDNSPSPADSNQIKSWDPDKCVGNDSTAETITGVDEPIDTENVSDTGSDSDSVNQSNIISRWSTQHSNTGKFNESLENQEDKMNLYQAESPVTEQSILSKTQQEQGIPGEENSYTGESGCNDSEQEIQEIQQGYPEGTRNKQDINTVKYRTESDGSEDRIDIYGNGTERIQYESYAEPLDDESDIATNKNMKYNTLGERELCKHDFVETSTKDDDTEIIVRKTIICLDETRIGKDVQETKFDRAKTGDVEVQDTDQPDKVVVEDLTERCREFSRDDDYDPRTQSDVATGLAQTEESDPNLTTVPGDEKTFAKQSATIPSQHTEVERELMTSTRQLQWSADTDETNYNEVKTAEVSPATDTKESYAKDDSLDRDSIVDKSEDAQAQSGSGYIERDTSVKCDTDVLLHNLHIEVDDAQKPVPKSDSTKPADTENRDESDEYSHPVQTFHNESFTDDLPSVDNLDYEQIEIKPDSPKQLSTVDRFTETEITGIEYLVADSYKTDRYKADGTTIHHSSGKEPTVENQVLHSAIETRNESLSSDPENDVSIPGTFSTDFDDDSGDKVTQNKTRSALRNKHDSRKLDELKRQVNKMQQTLEHLIRVMPKQLTMSFSVSPKAESMPHLSASGNMDLTNVFQNSNTVPPAPEATTEEETDSTESGNTDSRSDSQIGIIDAETHSETGESCLSCTTDDSNKKNPIDLTTVVPERLSCQEQFVHSVALNKDQFAGSTNTFVQDIPDGKTLADGSAAITEEIDQTRFKSKEFTDRILSATNDTYRCETGTGFQQLYAGRKRTMAESDVIQVTELLSKATVEGKTELSFKGQGLKLNDGNDAKEIVEEMSSFECMEVLNLEGNTLGVDAADAIGKALEDHPEFQKALWSDMFTGRLKTEIPDALKHLGAGIMVAGANLTELDLSDNAFGPNGMKGLTDLLESSSCYSLKKLKLNNNGLGVTGGQMLARCLMKCYEEGSKKGTPLQLQVFVSGRGRLENEGATALAEVFKAMGSLVEVIMPQNGIYHSGITALAEALADNRNLKHLDLNDNTFTERGAVAMAKALELLQNIETVILNDCLVRTDGAKAIAAALKDGHQSLRVLDLSHNEIRTKGANALAEAMEDKPNLERIDLDGNQLGKDGIDLICGTLEGIGKLELLGSLSEDEDTDDEESDEEDEEEEDDDVEEKHDSDTEKQNNHVSVQRTSAKDFLQFPSPTKLQQIGPQRGKNILDHLGDEVSDVDKAIQALSKVCSVVTQGDEKTKQAATECADAVMLKVFNSKDENIGSLVANCLLVHLGLIKSEDKTFRPVSDINGMLIVLDYVVRQQYFPKSCRDILHTFIAKPHQRFDSSSKSRHDLLQTFAKF